MRLLLVHADRFSFRVTQKTALAEPLPEGKGHSVHVDKDCLVVFCTIERVDGDNAEAAATQAAAEIADVAAKVRVNSVVIYPYAHLSHDLAPPDRALLVLHRLTAIVGSTSE